MIDFHFCPTPNCWKVAIMLDEAGLARRIIPYNIMKGDQLAASFRKINPNNKLPAIVDNDPAESGAPVTVFESGAILFYLAEKSGRFLPINVRDRMCVMQWLCWQIAGLGPMMGQASHFVRYAPERHEYSVNRYLKESRRLLNVLEYRLQESDFLSSEYSIADMAIWPWIHTISLLGFKLQEFPEVERWFNVIHARPAIRRVLYQDKETAIQAEYLQERRLLTPEEWSNTYGDRMLEAARPRDRGNS